MWAALRGHSHELLAILDRPAAVPYLVAAVVVSVAGLLLGMWSWRSVLVDDQTRLGVSACIRIFFVGLITKFMPGRVWALIVHIRLGRAVGLKAARMTAAYVLSVAVMILTGLTTGLMVGPALLGGRTFWLVVPALLVAVLIARPQLVDHAMALASRLLGRPRPNTYTSCRGIRLSILSEILAWLVSGLHLWAICLLLGAPALKSLPVCLGGFALATVAGGLTFILPDGIGAREGVSTLVLLTVLPWPLAVTAAVGSRLVTVVSEIATSGVAMLLTRSALVRPKRGDDV
jgi:glycosyltransferase 2 family protein